MVSGLNKLSEFRSISLNILWLLSLILLLKTKMFFNKLFSKVKILKNCVQDFLIRVVCFEALLNVLQVSDIADLVVNVLKLFALLEFVHYHHLEGFLLELEELIMLGWRRVGLRS